MSPRTARRESATADVAAPPPVLFDHLDDPRRLGSHMERPSWRTAWSSMAFEMDAAEGRRVGSRIRLRGRVLGLSLELVEDVVEHAPPHRKAWRTIGTPRLLVIGPYEMGFDIAPTASGSRLTVFIDYEPPPSNALGLMPMLSRFYARWCVSRMAQDARAHFQHAAHGAPERR